MGDLGVLAAWVRAGGAAELANVGGLLVALAGILLTLIQLLLLRRQLKLDALIKIMDSNREIVALGFEHPVVWSAVETGSGALLAEEALAQRHYLQLWMNHMQIIWAAWRLGLVSGREWEAYRQDMVEFFRVQSLREHWAKVARFYPPGFQKLVTALARPRDRNDAPSKGLKWHRLRREG
jgi:hypothetical protein